MASAERHPRIGVVETDPKPGSVWEALGELRAQLPAPPRLTIIDTFRAYNLDDMTGDLGAGIVVAVMLVPQAMAYSLLAGLPPVYGFYASIFTLIIYPFFGTSSVLAVGPVALMSLITAETLQSLGLKEASDEWVVAALQLSILVGLLQVLLGLMHAGYLVNFLSHPVLKGFTASAALIIGSSQLGKVLGFKIPRSSYVYLTWADAISGLAAGKGHGLTIAVSVANLFAFYALKWLKTYVLSIPYVKSRPGVARAVKAAPNILVVVLLNLLIVPATGWVDQGLGVVGTIPSGFPAPRNVLTPSFGEHASHLIPAAVVMALVGYMESISVAKAMAARTGKPVDASQELVGLGAANLIGSFFNVYPTTGGFARTSVNADAGARTPIAGWISAVILALVLQFLTPQFYYLPDASLGALIIFAVSKLLETETARHLYAVDKGDLLVYIASFLATLLVGIEDGIIVGALISIARVIKTAALPHVARLGALSLDKAASAGASAGSDHPSWAVQPWRNVRRFPDAVEHPDVTVLRFDAPLFFANAEFLKNTVLSEALPARCGTKYARLSDRQRPRQPKAILLDFSAVPSMDSEGVHTLLALPETIRKAADIAHASRIATLDRAIRRYGPSDAAAAAPAPTAVAPPDAEAPLPPVCPGDLREDDLALEAARNGDVARAKALRTLLAAKKPHVPLLFFSGVRGPLRDTINRDRNYEEVKKARLAQAAVPTVWNCTHPCTVTVPWQSPATPAADGSTAPFVTLAPAATTSVAEFALQEKILANPDNVGAIPLLLKHQDVGPAVEHIAHILASPTPSSPASAPASPKPELA